MTSSSRNIRSMEFKCLTRWLDTCYRQSNMLQYQLKHYHSSACTWNGTSHNQPKSTCDHLHTNYGWHIHKPSFVVLTRISWRSLDSDRDGMSLTWAVRLSANQQCSPSSSAIKARKLICRGRCTGSGPTCGNCWNESVNRTGCTETSERNCSY
jgi:hypothetical protein